MIAALPMYDRPELQAANDSLWSLVREQLGFGPVRLDREIGLKEGWSHPDLVLGQTCNLPYRLWLRDRVHVVGHPDFDLPFCQPGFYNSALIARKDDPRSLADLMAARVVINQDHSQSGHVTLWEYAQKNGFSPELSRESGGHVFSATMVAGGEADLAAIDAHSWRLIRRYDAHAAQLREIDRTRPTPAPPFICALRFDPAEVRAALRSAIGRLPATEKTLLNLRGVVEIPQATLLDIPTPDSLRAVA